MEGGEAHQYMYIVLDSKIYFYGPEEKAEMFITFLLQSLSFSGLIRKWPTDYYAMISALHLVLLFCLNVE